MYAWWDQNAGSPVARASSVMSPSKPVASFHPPMYTCGAPWRTSSVSANPPKVRPGLDHRPRIVALDSKSALIDSEAPDVNPRCTHRDGSRVPSLAMALSTSRSPKAPPSMQSSGSAPPSSPGAHTGAMAGSAASIDQSPAGVKAKGNKARERERPVSRWFLQRIPKTAGPDKSARCKPPRPERPTPCPTPTPPTK